MNKEIIEILRKNSKEIATMESCTSGLLASTLTNIEGASDVFKFGAITYSNEYKIKFGVPKEVIDKYSVYSIETANEMAKSICFYTNSDYGIGITGKLGVEDKNNKFGENNIVYISIYDKLNDSFFNQSMTIDNCEREEAKKRVVEITLFKLLNILKKL